MSVKRAPVTELWCIDPSLKAMGFAKFSRRSSRASWELEASGCIKGRKGDDTWNRIDECTYQVLERVGEIALAGEGGVLMLIEEPAHYDGGAGTAARNSGAILKLISLAATIRALVLSCGGDVLMVPVRKWKGNAPKTITQRRVRRAWNWEGTDHNEADAVGMGDWWIRKGPGKNTG